MNNGAEQDQDKQNLFAVVSSEDSEEPEFEELSGPVKKRRGIYLLPNLLTTGAMFGGFYAILAAMNGKFEAAAVAIFVAMLFDGLDGRVARMTHTESDFGVQYDSLSDMVSFGVAPAVVSFSWMLYTLGKLGWAGAFIYASCAALRLARFNTQVGTADSRFFSGLASPAAAGLVAAMVWTGYDAEPSRSLALMALFVTAIAGYDGRAVTLFQHERRGLSRQGAFCGDFRHRYGGVHYSDRPAAYVAGDGRDVRFIRAAGMVLATL